MKRKTIKAVINRKFKDFLQSIDDKSLRDEMSSSAIITGGCITSMLLNEKVNDFDMYFKDITIARRIALYYIKKAKKKWSHKITVEETSGRLYLNVESSGSASDSKVIHIDDLLNDEEKYTNLDDNIFSTEENADQSKKYDVIHVTSNAITLSGNVQIITRFFGDPAEIHKNFDFVHCQAYWTSWDNELELPPKTLEAIINKELVYHGSLYPICSIIRTRKFIKRGWNINAGQYLKMCFQISQLDLSDLEVLKDQLVGVDALYFMEILDQLQSQKERDANFYLSSSYLFEIINRVF